MYSVLRRIDSIISVVQSGIATLVEARNLAARMQKQASNTSATYYVKGHPRQDTAKATTSGSPPSRDRDSNTAISQQVRHNGGKYRVICVRGGQKQYIKGKFATEDEACPHALALQKATTNPGISYQVEYPSSEPINTHAPVRSRESIPQKRPSQGPSGPSKRTSAGSLYTVVCFRPGNKKTFRGNYRSYSDARDRVIELHAHNPNPFIKYYVEHDGRLISVSTGGISSPRKSPSRKAPSRKPPKERSPRRSPKRETEDRARESYFQYWDSELLGLGIPAQTGHGRRSRKWFNDPT